MIRKWFYISLVWAAVVTAMPASAAGTCLFGQSLLDKSGKVIRENLLADGKSLRDRGVFAVRVVDVGSSQSFETLNEEVKTAVMSTLKKARLAKKDFFKKQGLVEQYAAGKFTGEASGMYLIVTYSTGRAVKGRVFRLRSGTYMPVADVVNSSVENCTVNL